QNGTPGQPLDLGGTKVEVVAPAGGVLTLHYPYVNCDPKLNHAYQGCRRYEGRLEFEGLPDGRIIARNKINLRQYLTGVVPHEMPASWETDALKAQTVVARTYAARQNYGLDQNLVDSTYDQVFYGRYEDGTSDGRYEQKIDSIVKATDGQLLYYQGQMATGNFGSANGGWIASNTEAFGDGTGTPLPYMTGREDRYRLPDGTTVTPESYWRGNQKYEATYFRWEREFATSVIESKWPQVGQLQSIEVVKRSNTWTALRIRVTGSAGSVEVSGRDFRSKLGLPSTMLLPDKLFPRQFYDVKEGALAAEINLAYQLNLISGDIYARFHPEDPLIRSAFVKMLVNAVEASTGTQLPGPDNDPNTQDEPFSDVTPDQALYEYVVKAYKVGLVQGYEDGTFGYDRNITREEAAAIVQRALDLPEAKESFTDVPDTSRFAGAIGAVAAAGIMKGYSQTEFKPRATMKRGEAAAVALRSYDHCQAKGCNP
ncbi:MAG TPA: SpoIID/LytB domain-containing protein, partial [Calditerricola sp.]